MGVKIADTIKSGFSTLFSNKTVMVLAVIAGILNAIIGLFVPAASLGSSLSSMPSVGITGVLAAIVIGLVLILVSASTFSAVAKESDLGDAFRKGASRYFWLIATEIVVGLILVVPVLLLVLPLALSSVGLFPIAFAAVLALIGFVLTFFLSIRLSIAQVGSVVGGMGPIESVKNSWSATKGSFWQIFAVFLVLGIIVWIISLIATLLFYAVGVPSIGRFVGTFFAYSIVVATVLVYQQLSGSGSSPARKQKK